MIKKTVEQIIRKKMKQWTDELPKTLRQDVMNNILVSGGAIASLFRQEPVNDFDIYFKDMDVLIRLCEYYKEQYGTPDLLDGRKIMEYVADNIQERFNNSKYSAHEYIQKEQYKRFGPMGDMSAAFVQIMNLSDDRVRMLTPAGGYLVEYKDKKGKDIPEEELDKFRPVFVSPNAISLSDKIQIVTRFTGTPEQIHANYDFIHATNYWDFENGLVLNLEAMTCLLTSELKYQGSRYPLTSILRMKKFVNRKWKINAGEVLKIMIQISKLDLEDPNVLEEQLIGVDVAYFSRLVHIIRGMYTKDQDFKLTKEYLWDWIEKVFDRAEEIEEDFELEI